MNCKPGDLAVVVKGLDGRTTNVGVILTVVTRAKDMDGLPAWRIVTAQPCTFINSRTGKKSIRNHGRVQDFRLQPIRPQAQKKSAGAPLARKVSPCKIMTKS